MPTPAELEEMAALYATTAAQMNPFSRASARAPVTSCPPEERAARAPRQRRGWGFEIPDGPVPAGWVDSRPRAHATTQQPTPEPETPASTSEEKPNEHIEDISVITDSAPSPSNSPVTASDSDGRLAQSITAVCVDDNTPRYLAYPPLPRNQLSPNSTSSFLHPGSKFKGTQQSDRQVYDVQVEIKDVNLAESSLCGYLRIQGLTDDHPTLTTFFSGEVIGPKYLFRTAHTSWNTSEKNDLQHWARFPAWRPLAKAAKTSSHFTPKNYLEREHLFMRWKEYFLVPDHRVKSISGASFEGFYYICFDQRVGSVSGIYFHAKSEKFQQLELRHVPDGGCFGAVEFR